VTIEDMETMEILDTTAITQLNIIISSVTLEENISTAHLTAMSSFTLLDNSSLTLEEFHQREQATAESMTLD